MTEHERLPETSESQPRVAGLVAEFAGPEALVAAAAEVRQSGYRDWDAHSPYPVHGIERAMGIRPTILPWLVLGAGIAGCVVALVLQWWTNGVHYPIIVSGKPLLALPANIPVAFELIVLFAALTAFVGVLALNKLPQFWHPVFSAKRFVRATSDGFFLSVEATDPKFDEQSTGELLRSVGAVGVETCYAPVGGAQIPKAIYWAIAVLAALSLIPPLWAAKARVTTSETPRIRLAPDMVVQPKYQAQQASSLFADGRTMRPPVAGTVAVGGLRSDPHLYQGKVGNGWATTYPMPVDSQLVQRGQERYRIYCSTCHGLGGDGDGMVAQRAARRAEPNWVPPLSLHVDSVRQQPVGQLFNTITHGIRKMPAYGVQIAPADRWAIVLYVRALQRSQNATLDDIPQDLKDQLR